MLKETSTELAALTSLTSAAVSGLFFCASGFVFWPFSMTGRNFKLHSMSSLPWFMNLMLMPNLVCKLNFSMSSISQQWKMTESSKLFIC